MAVDEQSVVRNKSFIDLILNFFVDKKDLGKLTNKNFMYQPRGFSDFLHDGFTKLDLVARMTSVALAKTLSYLFLVEFFEKIVGPVCKYLLLDPIAEKIKSTNLAWLRVAGFIFIVLGAGVSATIIEIVKMVRDFLFRPIVELVLHVSLRAVSTPLGLLSAPFYLAGQTIYNSDTPVQTAVKGVGVLSLVVSAGLWIALAAGVFTPAVLGTSTLAVSLIALAWPAIIGMGVVSLVSAVGLLGHGLYKKCCRSEEEYTGSLCNH